MTETIRVWDPALRLFKWGLVISVAGALLAENAGEMDRHAQFGFAALSLVFFRIIWGFIGPETARFSRFVKGPAAIIVYLRSGKWSGNGHNPLGALSVLALLAIVLVQAGTGIFSNDDIFFDGPWAGYVGKQTSDLLTGWHHRLSNVLWALIGLHVAVVLWHSIRGDDLIRPMITGRKKMDGPQPAQVPLWRAVPAAAAAIFLAGLVMRYWIT
ncbi:cytochrome b/b6 domain-containing protein [Rhodobacteraceae bacterium NNCM2]|nr:cytochrome b/b6 domain-containing protein [Coraliihabitans acroporae]